MSPLSNEDRRLLLQLARRAIVDAVCAGRQPESPAAGGALAERRGAFVTLFLRRRLRGCVGKLEPDESLAQAVMRCAMGAALADPRFRPVRAEEIAELEVEVSVLSPVEPVRPEEIEVGRHGLVVERGSHRGVLLPQVAAQRAWARERFLQESCAKAGLEPNAWKDPETRMWAFTAESFSEADFDVPSHAQSN